MVEPKVMAETAVEAERWSAGAIVTGDGVVAPAAAAPTGAALRDSVYRYRLATRVGQRGHWLRPASRVPGTAVPFFARAIPGNAEYPH